MDGIIVLNKPKGITSFKAIQIIKKAAGIKKIGHAGTLDPSATGVLIVCTGNACKFSSLLMGKEKEYEAEITFGITTDSGDADGKILSSQKASLTRGDIEKTIPALTGEIEQIPPMVSALHHKGERLYDLARRGITVDRPPRKVTVHEIKILSFTDGENPKARIMVRCSKGTYIRTLCEDIGKAIGCGAFESELVRTRVGQYDIKDSVTLEEAEKLSREGRIREVLRHALR